MKREEEGEESSAVKIMVIPVELLVLHAISRGDESNAASIYMQVSSSAIKKSNGDCLFLAESEEEGEETPAPLEFQLFPDPEKRKCTIEDLQKCFT